MREIKSAVILGANGAMGSGCAAILAGFGNMKVHMLAREEAKAEKGIQAAVRSVRSGVIKERMIAGSYEKDLEKAVAESDWVFECVAETYSIKEEINARVAKARRPGTLLSTVSSGLSIARLASAFDADGQKHYYGTHFFNPPYKLTLCELVIHPANDTAYTKELSRYLSRKLRRHVVVTNDTPAFAGNRIGFQFMNEAAQMAEKYEDKGGIYLMDSLLGAYTGRAMSPLATVDLVGLDVHKAIVSNIYENSEASAEARETFALPAYMQDLIAQGCLGMKSKQGLYSKTTEKDGSKKLEVYNIAKKKYEAPRAVEIPFKAKAVEALQNSDYKTAVSIFKEAKGWEAELLRHFIARYISYSFSLIPQVSEQEGIDGAMGFGFNWLPPSAWVDLLGGLKESCRFLEAQKMPVPEFLSKASQNGSFYTLQSRLDYRSLFKAA